MNATVSTLFILTDEDDHLEETAPDSDGKFQDTKQRPNEVLMGVVLLRGVCFPEQRR